MHNYIYIVSRYLGHKDGVNRFHFIGYFDGVRISRVMVKGGEFEKGEDYVLAISEVQTQDTTLFGVLIKSKKLFI